MREDNADNVWHEYQVIAEVETAPGEFVQFTTDWMRDRKVAIRAMEEFQDSGHSAEIRSRRYHSAVKREEVPER